MKWPASAPAGRLAAARRRGAARPGRSARPRVPKPPPMLAQHLAAGDGAASERDHGDVRITPQCVAGRSSCSANAKLVVATRTSSIDERELVRAQQHLGVVFPRVRRRRRARNCSAQLHLAARWPAGRRASRNARRMRAASSAVAVGGHPRRQRLRLRHHEVAVEHEQLLQRHDSSRPGGRWSGSGRGSRTAAAAGRGCAG